MTIYFQHVGERGATRDFPRTIGTRKSGLMSFQIEDIETYLAPLTGYERSMVKTDINEKAPDGFQIWGIPAGAKSVLKKMETGDYLLLLESITEGGFFAYGGEVVSKVPQELPALSRFLWTEAHFPLILLLRGALLHYPWPVFCTDFKFNMAWNPAGQTYRLKEERLIESPYGGEMAFRKELRRFIVPSAA
jgi:5-methylcytosine-specific restriction protein A